MVRSTEIAIVFFHLLLGDGLLPVSANLTPLKIKVRDISVIANRDGIFVSWDSSDESYSVSAVDPLYREQFKCLATKDANVFQIPSNQLHNISTVELTIVATTSKHTMDPVFITVQLNQDQAFMKLQDHLMLAISITTLLLIYNLICCVKKRHKRFEAIARLNENAHHNCRGPTPVGVDLNPQNLVVPAAVLQPGSLG